MTAHSTLKTPGNEVNSKAQGLSGVNMRLMSHGYHSLLGGLLAHSAFVAIKKQNINTTDLLDMRSNY